MEKNVVLFIQGKREEKDAWPIVLSQLPHAYANIELDKFKNSWRRLEVLDTIKEGWTLIQTTDLLAIYKLRVMRRKGQISNLIFINAYGEIDNINDRGRHEGHISTAEELLDDYLAELIS